MRGLWKTKIPSPKYTKLTHVRVKESTSLVSLRTLKMSMRNSLNQLLKKTKVSSMNQAK